MEFCHKYQKIYDYFDDWILIKTNEEDTEITDIVVKKMSENHIETCEWQDKEFSIWEQIFYVMNLKKQKYVGCR